MVIQRYPHGKNASCRAGQLALLQLLWKTRVVETEFRNAFSFIWDGNFDSSLVSDVISRFIRGNAKIKLLPVF